jgi:hypothetical protein
MLATGLIATVGLNARGRVVVTIQFKEAINGTGHVNGNVINQFDQFHSNLLRNEVGTSDQCSYWAGSALQSSAGSGESHE